MGAGKRDGAAHPVSARAKITVTMVGTAEMAEDAEVETPCSSAIVAVSAVLPALGQMVRREKRPEMFYRRIVRFIWVDFVWAPDGFTIHVLTPSASRRCHPKKRLARPARVADLRHLGTR